jgi:AcrR family transcriptional regulator
METKPIADPPKRRRRSPEAAVREIVAAAEELLAERPFRELSVDEVMARTTLSRSSFYVYFRDRYDLLLRLVSEIGDEVQEMADRWLVGVGDPRANVLNALEGVVAVYARHGLVMRAIADAAGADPLVESVYSDLIERFVRGSAAHIARDEATAGGLDPAESARALVWMTERYLAGTLGTIPPRQSPQTVVATLNAIWVRALYGGQG